MATEVKERKSYTPEERQKHLDATKDMAFSDQEGYCAKHGVSINTLRSWRRAADGTTSTKGKKKAAKKSAKKKAAKKPDPNSGKRRGRPPGRPKKAAKKPDPNSGKRRGRPPGRPKKASVEVVTPTGVKGRVKAKLVEDFENKLSGGTGTLDDEMHALLTDVHNAL